MSSIRELILYQDLERKPLFQNFARLIEYGKREKEGRSDAQEKEKRKALYYGCLHELVELSESHGFSGNLWHTFLAYLLVNHENAYSRACELYGETEGTMNRIALHDFAVFKELFDFDFRVLEEALDVTGTDFITDYRRAEGDTGSRLLFHPRIRDRICELAEELREAADAEAFRKAVTGFYRDFGVGTLDRKSVV